MAASGGSELSWGVVLFLWLAAMGVGARLGARWGGIAAARWGPVLELVLAGGGVVVLRATPALVGAAAGEAVVALRAAWVWAAAVVPAAMVGGWCFPVLAGTLARRDAAAAAYALEGLGALAGGLVFTFLLAPLGAAAAVTLALGAVASLALGRRAPAVATGVALLAVAVSLVAGNWLAQLGWRWSGRIGELAAWRDTHEQRLEISSGPPFSLYADGRLVSTVPDPYRADPIGHLLLLLHPSPRRVLAVGAAAEGVLPAMLQHPVEHLKLVEEDRALPRWLVAWMGGEVAAALDDPRVSVRAVDPVAAVRGRGEWDLVLLRDGDPTTLRRNRTRTREFFLECRARLAPAGVLAVRVGVADTYLGGPGGELLAVLAATLRSVFPAVVGIPGEEVLLLASVDGDLRTTPEVLAARRAARQVPEHRFPDAMLPVLLDPDRAGHLARFLASSASPANTAARPCAVPVAAARAEGRGSPRLARLVAGVVHWPQRWLWTAVGGVAVLLVAVGARGAPLAGGAAAVVGAASMGWFLVLLSVWQGREGSTYSAVGALTAAFMAGLVGGAVAGRRVGAAGRWLAPLLGGGALFSLGIGALAARRPAGAVVVLSLVVGGSLVGAAFPALSWRLGGERTRVGAGHAFAADELGAAAGALLVGVVVIPWAGMAGAASALAVLLAATAVAVALADGRRRRG